MPATNVVISLTPHQKLHAPAMPFQALRKALYAAQDELPPPIKMSVELFDEKATIRIGGSLKEPYYNKLKHLAESNGISMSRAAIRLLQLPERP
jgi:hypothetical protein